MRMGTTGCPETSVRNYATRSVITQKSAVLSYFAAEASNDEKVDYFVLKKRKWEVYFSSAHRSTRGISKFLP
jgi:hypothetical protein